MTEHGIEAESDMVVINAVSVSRALLSVGFGLDREEAISMQYRD
jgi:hypothetical protein